MAMYLAWEVCGLRQREIGEEFGISLFAVSKAIWRVEKVRREDGRVAKAVDKLIAAVQA